MFEVFKVRDKGKDVTGCSDSERENDHTHHQLPLLLNGHHLASLGVLNQLQWAGRWGRRRGF